MTDSMIFAADSICDSKWKIILVGDDKYSVCATERDGSWKVCLTNLIEIWTEDLDREKILRKCEKLNPNLCTEDIDVYEFVSRILRNIPNHATKVSARRIELQRELEGGIFEFVIDLIKGDPLQLWKEVTMPLCLAAGRLRWKQTILLDLVKKKDIEISEYKLNGAELIRKHIRTEAFHETWFEKNQPNLNADSCQNVFQTIVELEGIATKRFTSSTEKLDGQETSVKNEAEEHSEENNSILVVDNEISDDKPNSGLVPKAEISHTSISPKRHKSVMTIDDDKNSNAAKRAQSYPTSSVKRTKKDIHDFIRG